MEYSKAEVQEMIMDRKADLRKAVPNPSEGTLASWKMEDFKDGILLEQYEDEDMVAELKSLRTAFKVK